MLQVKSEAELRHVIAHLYAAIEALTNGCHLSAQDELGCIHGLVFFESEEEAEAYYRSQGGHDGGSMPKATEAYQTPKEVVD